MSDSLASLVVATHNLMRGRGLAGLLPTYQRLRASVGLDVLCIQEDHPTDGNETLAARIAAFLGTTFAHHSDGEASGLAVVYDRERVALAERSSVPLPRLERLSWLERRYMRGGQAASRPSLLTRFTTRSGHEAVVGTFHLEAAGGNQFRAQQMQVLAEAIAPHPSARPVVVCGDTNAFGWTRGRHGRALAHVMGPLERLGLRAPAAGPPTHYFARQREPMTIHRLCVLAGRLGLDLPRRLDVVLTNRAADHGHVSTPASDHDLVWARVQLDQAAPAPE